MYTVEAFLAHAHAHAHIHTHSHIINSYKSCREYTSAGQDECSIPGMRFWSCWVRCPERDLSRDRYRAGKDVDSGEQKDGKSEKSLGVRYAAYITSMA